MDMSACVGRLLVLGHWLDHKGPGGQGRIVMPWLPFHVSRLADRRDAITYKGCQWAVDGAPSPAPLGVER